MDLYIVYEVLDSKEIDILIITKDRPKADEKIKKVLSCDGPWRELAPNQWRSDEYEVTLKLEVRKLE